MNIKTFSFPSFNEWNKTRQYSQKIGDYTSTIKTIAWGCNGNTKNDYEAAIANSDNPTNIYVSALFADFISCDVSDTTKLKKWYESVVIKLNDSWKTFILETYLNTEKVANKK